MKLRPAVARIVRHGLFPLLAFGPGALVLLVLGPEASARSMPPRSALLAGIATIVASYALLAWLERRFPYREQWNVSQGDVRTDVAYLALVGPASALLGGSFALALAQGLHHVLPDALRADLWPARWPAVGQVLLACLLAELGHYAVHRLGHELPLLWRLHAIHHSARRLYWLNATRFHPLDLMLLACLQALPLEVLGIPPGIYLAYFVVSSCYGQLQHCNLDVDTRSYSWILATPELHRWHHSRHPHEGNSNYGAILIVWDVLFGTRFWPGAPITEPVGIGDLPGFPEGLGDQLTAPFRWKSIEATARGADAPIDSSSPDAQP